ncbi:MAG: glycosyl hydrolase [Lacipirellulaceae bacterium]
MPRNPRTTDPHRFGAWLVLACAVGSAPSAAAMDVKRGSAGGGIPLANAVNSRWYYDWGNNPPADVLNGSFNGKYTPMIWSSNAGTIQTRIDNILGYASTLGVDHVMGFNEPDRADQANMSVADAVALWDVMDHQFASAGIKLVSPQLGDDTGGRAWMDDFMAQANTLNLTIDAVGMHWYGSVSPTNPVASANAFLGRVDHWHTRYGKPIWISEFAGMDWGADDITSPALIAANEAFLSVVIPGLESRSHVERYSWWQFGRRSFSPEEDPAGTRYEDEDTRLINQVGGLWTPTGIGDQYVPSYREGEQFNLSGTTPGETNFYLRGGSLLNTTGPTPVTVATVDAIDGNSDIGGGIDWRIDGGAFRVRSGATLRKIGANRVTVGASSSNAGEIEVVSGVLALDKGVQLTGVGSVEVLTGGTLALGSATDRSGVVIGQQVELNGGSIQSNQTIDGVHAISGPVMVRGTSTLAGSGTVVVNGPLQSPVSGPVHGIVKEGTGAVVLAANSPTFRGGVLVKGGTLAMAAGGAMPAASGFTVDSGGRFDVSDRPAGLTLASGQVLTNKVGGVVAGDVVVGNGAEISAAGAFDGNVVAHSGGTLSVGGLGSASAPQTVILTPPNGATGSNSDVRVRSGSNAGSTQGDTTALGIGSISATDAFRSLLTFDLSSTGITNPSHIQSVALTMTLQTPNGAQVNTPSAPSLELLTIGAYNSDTATFNNTPFNSANLISTTTGPNFTAYTAGATIGWADSTTDAAPDTFVDAVKSALGSSLHLGARAAATSPGTRSFYFIDHSETPTAGAAPSLAITYAAPPTSGIGSAVFDGDLTMASGSALEIDLLSTTSFDQIDVNGVATLNGVLAIDALNLGGLNVNDTFTILTADSLVNNLTLGGPDGAMFRLAASTATELKLTYVGVAPVPGDFNGDQVVNAADFSVWRDNLGSPEGTLLSGSGTGGVIDQDDYDLWATNYGAVALGASLASAVPEPGAAVLFLGSLAASCPIRRRVSAATRWE